MDVQWFGTRTGRCIRPDDTAIEVTQLQATLTAVRPHPPLIATDQARDRAGRRRVLVIAVEPAQQLAITRVIAQQLVVGTDPYPALAILADRTQPGLAQRRIGILLDPATARVDMIQHPRTANHPQAIARGRSDGGGQWVAQAIDAGTITLQLDELAPVRWQVPKTVVHAAKPQPAFAILIAQHPRWPHRPSGHATEHRDIIDPATITAQAQAPTGVVPGLAVAVLDQQLQRLLARLTVQLRHLDLAIGLHDHRATAGADPDPALTVSLQGIDQR